MAEELFRRWVRPLERSPLPAGYGAEPDIARYHAPDPLYSAVHLVDDADPKWREYSPRHVHAFPEVNILAGPPGALVFRIRLGDEEGDVESPAAIVIPPGVAHSANLVRGSGAFVVLRLAPDQLQAMYDPGTRD